MASDDPPPAAGRIVRRIGADWSHRPHGGTGLSLMNGQQLGLAGCPEMGSGQEARGGGIGRILALGVQLLRGPEAARGVRDQDGAALELDQRVAVAPGPRGRTLAAGADAPCAPAIGRPAGIEDLAVQGHDRQTAVRWRITRLADAGRIEAPACGIPRWRADSATWTSRARPE